MGNYLNAVGYQPNYNQFAKMNTGNQFQSNFNNYGTNIFQQNNVFNNSMALPNFSSQIGRAHV